MKMSGFSALQVLADIGTASLQFDGEEDLVNRSSEETVSFIRKNFQKKVCSNFVAAEMTVHDLSFDEVLCVCGSPQKDHPDASTFGSFSDVEVPGLYVEELKPTDAFGQLAFHPRSLSYQEPAEYVRLTDSSDPSAVLTLMCDHWKLTSPDPPSLVVSLVGGGYLFGMSELQTREIFNRGLVKAIKSTKGWLVTDGLNMGVAKAVGAAVLEGQTLEWSQTQDLLERQNTIKCIGIATWSHVQNREVLTNRNPKRANFVDYLVDPVVREGDAVSLNPNHSHFFLVDTGVSSDGFQQNQGNAEFRAALERQISLSKRWNLQKFCVRLQHGVLAKFLGDGGLDVPVVCLMVEGGLNTLEQVGHSIRQGLPAVICGNTGRAADVLGWALQQYKRIINIGDVFTREQEEYDLRTRVKDRARSYDILKPEDEAGYEMLVDMVMEICYSHEQITIFHVGQNSSLDEALLLSILDSQHKADPLKQLELAQRWNRADVAARILNDPRHFFLATTRNLGKLMVNLTRALIFNKVEFVRLYLDSGVPVKKFLTPDTLCQLYSETVIHAKYLWKRLAITKSISRKTLRKLTLQDIADQMTLKRVNKALKSFGRTFRQPEYEDTAGSATFSEPMQHLFCWAVMLNRQELAILFWERCTNPLINAVAGTVMCKCLSEHDNLEGSTKLKLEFANFKMRLEKLASGLLKEAYKQNMSKAVLLAKRPSPTWGNLTSMSLAGIAEDQKFLASECCQSAIRDTWKRGYNARVLHILFSVFFIFPIFFLIQFDKQPPLLCRCRAGACNCHRNQSKKRSPHLNLGRLYNRDVSNTQSTQSQHYRRTTLASGDALDFLPDLEYIGKCMRDKKKPSRKIALWLKRMFIFYYSPVVKFVTHTFSYCLYLALYAAVVLNLKSKAEKEKDPDNFSLLPWELLLYIWQGTFVCEELRIILWHPGSTIKNTIIDWWLFSGMHTWNRWRLISYILSILAIILRLFDETYAIAKAVLVLNFITYTTHIFKIYTINGYLGPKVFMMRRMMLDLLMFILVFAVFYLSYSVSFNAFYKPKPNETVPSILTVGIWEIFGEVNDEDFLGVACEKPPNNTNSSAEITECNYREGLILLLLVLYLFCTAILLVNMLIATFTHTFDNIHKNAKQIWRYQMYFLIEEFRTKPLLPEPLIIFEHAFLLIRHFVRGYTRMDKFLPADDIGWERPLTKTERHFLNVFESACRADYVDRKKKRCACTCGKCKCWQMLNVQHRKGNTRVEADSFHLPAVYEKRSVAY